MIATFSPSAKRIIRPKPMYIEAAKNAGARRIPSCWMMYRPLRSASSCFAFSARAPKPTISTAWCINVSSCWGKCAMWDGSTNWKRKTYRHLPQWKLWSTNSSFGSSGRDEILYWPQTELRKLLLLPRRAHTHSIYRQPCFCLVLLLLWCRYVWSIRRGRCCFDLIFAIMEMRSFIRSIKFQSSTKYFTI